MKEQKQISSAFSQMSNGKKKQLFSILMSEFRSGSTNPKGAMQGPTSVGTTSVLSKKKKSTSIDRRTAAYQSESSAKPGSKTASVPAHKKSKSYIGTNIAEIMKNDRSGNPVTSNREPLNSLDNSFIRQSINQSYEKLISETLEAQNHSNVGVLSYHSKPATSTVGKHNNTLHMNKANYQTASVTAKQSKQINPGYIDRTRGGRSQLQNQSANSSHKSLSTSKYESISKKKSRRTDHLSLNTANQQFMKNNWCGTAGNSYRAGSKKASPSISKTTTLTMGSKYLVREARTKPSSPERSYAAINTTGYHTNKQSNNTGQHYISANLREEQQVLNMISNLQREQVPTSAGHAGQKQRPCHDGQAVPTSKRKNFKNLFYSPKGESQTEPHSKVTSQFQTRQNSPARGASPISNSPQMVIIGASQPPMRVSKGPRVASKQNQGIKATFDKADVVPDSSFLDQSYDTKLRKPRDPSVEASYQSVKHGYSSTSASNMSSKTKVQKLAFSSTGTPLSIHNKYNIQAAQKSKNLNIVGQKPHNYSTGNSKGPKFISHTTGMVSAANSPRQMNKGQISSTNHGQKRKTQTRINSEAPSPVAGAKRSPKEISNQEINNSGTQSGRKRGVSTSAVGMSQINGTKDLISGQKVVMTFKGKPVVIHNQGSQGKHSGAPSSIQQQFLFNQFLKNNKHQPRLGSQVQSQDHSLERDRPLEPMIKENVDYETFDQRHLQELTPRTKEVQMITQLIKECFDKHGKPPKTQVELYKIGKILGKGAFGKVNLGLQRLTRKIVAIKSINKDFMKDESSKKKMSNEIDLLKSLRHQNVVKLLETMETEKHHLIVMELCPGGDLLNYVRKRRKLTEQYAKFVFLQIMEGIAYCHENGVVHRDIKLDNILMDGKGKIKIGDFGVSRKAASNEILFEQCGTPAYIAPEIVRELGYKGFPVDIWSAGVCLYAMLYGNVPFKANQMGDLNKMIVETQIEFKDTASEKARDLMVRMLQKAPSKRLTAAEVLEHPWFEDTEQDLNIFDEQEIDLIRKEFTYVGCKNKLKAFDGNPDAEQYNLMNTEFTTHSFDKTEDSLVKNNSSRSVILCPFNSAVKENPLPSLLTEEVLSQVEDKDIILRFHIRVREIDKDYEKFNNADFDNGVYHKYAYNQGKKKDGEDDDLKPDDPDQTLDATRGMYKLGQSRKPRFDVNEQNIYLKKDEEVLAKVEKYGFPRDFIIRCINENVNNHCTTSYYLLCMDQVYQEPSCIADIDGQ